MGVSYKNIWILNHYAIPPNVGGGTRHYDFAEELVKRGYKVTIFASSFDHKLRKEKLNKKELWRKENINGVDFIWIKTHPYKKNDIHRIINMITFAYRLYFVGKKIKDKPETIIASSFHPFTCISGYYLAKKFKAKYLAEIRDLWPQTAIDMGAIKESSIIAKLLKKLEKFIYQKAEKIIVLLPGAVNYIQSAGINKDKVVYIPNGVNVKRFDLQLSNGYSEYVDRILQEHQGYFKAIYLGAFGQANALDVIIEAAREVQNRGYEKIHFLFVGDGPEKEKLINKIYNCNINNVFFYTPVKKTEVPLLLSKIDIQLISMRDIPLYKYGISLNKIFDYLCASRPIIMSGNPLNDIVSESNSGITVPPEDSDALANAIIKIYNMSENERNLLGKNGREYVQKYHNISILVDKLIQTLTEVNKEI